MSDLVDISHPIEAGMVTYPGLPGPALSEYLSREESRSHYAEGAEFHIGRIEMVANTGTYLDTPFHRYPDGHDVAGLSLARCSDLPGLLVQARDQAIGPDGFAGKEVEGRAVLFATGWDRHWRTERYGDAAHPFLTEDAAEALVERGAALVGIDSANIDDTNGATRPIHTRLLGAGIPIVEHLTALEALDAREFRFFAVPAPVRGMGSFPVRAFALVD